MLSPLPFDLHLSPAADEALTLAAQLPAVLVLDEPMLTEILDHSLPGETLDDTILRLFSTYH